MSPIAIEEEGETEWLQMRPRREPRTKDKKKKKIIKKIKNTLNLASGSCFFGGEFGDSAVLSAGDSISTWDGVE